MIVYYSEDINLYDTNNPQKTFEKCNCLKFHQKTDWSTGIMAQPPPPNPDVLVAVM
jgi:hypothetical protein